MSESATPTLLVVCPHCHKTNRLPAARRHERPQCGQCGQPLLTGAPVELDALHFDTHVTRNQLPVVVDFWAPWCGPCRMMAPAFAEVAAKLEGEVIFAKVNTEEEQQLAARYAIRSIPTVLVMREGREIARQSGAMNAAQLGGWLRGVLPNR